MERTLFEEEHDGLRASFRAWLDKEIVPNYLEWEAGGDRPPTTSSSRAGKHGFVGMNIPEEHGGGGTGDFRYNQVIDEEIQMAGVGGRRPRYEPPQRHLRAVLPRVLHRGATGALDAGDRVRRAGDRHRHDRAGPSARTSRA